MRDGERKPIVVVVSAAVVVVVIGIFLTAKNTKSTKASMKREMQNGRRQEPLIFTNGD